MYVWQVVWPASLDVKSGTLGAAEAGAARF